MSGSYLSADDFLRGVLGEPEDLAVEGLGLVRVRGLSVAEVARAKRAAGNDPLLLMVHMVAEGLVQPPLTAQQLLALRAGMTPRFEVIAVRVAELSGLGDDQEKLDAFPGGGS
jgi:hypothetical protein